ncbi:MAG: caspase family protein [Saprospiraceae bacterium]|nr:caspase family protein [Saprospiraceae bacterium]
MKIGSEEGLRELNVLLGPMESAMLMNLNKCNNFTTMKNLEYIFLVFLFLLRVQGFGQAIRGVKPLNSANVMPNRNYGIVIGISDYKNIPDLQYADRDAMAFGKFLSQISIPIVDSSNLMIYINDAANRINVCDGISKLIKKLQPGDRVYFYFAGHGDIEALSQAKNGLLLLYDSPPGDYFGLNDGVLQVNQLADYFGRLSDMGVDVFYIIDACHSGKLKGGEQGRLHTSRAIQYLLSQRSTVLLSCDEDQLSLEGAAWGGGRGLFSYYLEQGLIGLAEADQDNLVSIYELDQFVTHKTYSESEKRQTPVILGTQNKVVNKISPQYCDSIRELDSRQYRVYSNVNYKGSDQLFYSMTDTILLKELEGFKQRLHTNPLLHTESSSYGYYKNLESQYKQHYIIDLLKRALIVKLNARFDSLVSPIIKGKNPNFKLETCLAVSEELDSCLALLDTDHYMHNYFLARKYYVLALIKAHGIHINNYGPLFQRKLVEAIQLLKDSKQLEPNASYVHYTLGLYYQTMQQLDSSYYYLNVFLTLLPYSELAYNSIGITLGDMKSYSESIHCFKRAIELNKNYRPPYVNLIQMYVETYQFEKGIQIAKQAIALNPKLPEGYNNLADLYRKRRDYNLAIKLVNKSLTVMPDRPRTLLLKAKILFDAGNHGDAEQLIIKLIKFRPDYGEAYYYLALIQKHRCQYQDAISILDRYLELDSLSSECLTEKAYCFKISNQPDSSEWYFRSAVKFLETHSDKSEQLAEIYHFGLHQLDSAFVYYQASLVNNPTNFILLSNYIGCLFAMGKTKQAKAEMKLLISLPESQIPLVYVRICEQIIEGNYRKALINLQKLVKLDSSYKWHILIDPCMSRLLSCDPSGSH